MISVWLSFNCKQLQMHEVLLNAWLWGCAGVRSGAGRGRGMEQAGGAPGLYDAPPLGMLSSRSHAVHMLLQAVGESLQVVLACGIKEPNMQSQGSFFGADAFVVNLHLTCYTNLAGSFRHVHITSQLDKVLFKTRAKAVKHLQVDVMPLAPP